MEAQTIIIWHSGSPAMVTEQVASKYGLSRGQQVEDANLLEMIVEDKLSQNACCIEAARNGEDHNLINNT